MKSTQKSNGEKKGRKPQIKKLESEKKYVMLRHTATADVAFEAYGETETELLIHAGLATESVMAELSTIKPVVKHEISLSAETFEKILLLFLEELVYLKDAESLLFSKIEARLKHTKHTEHTKKEEYTLTANCFGEKIDPTKHTLHNDVKAVTYHLFKVEKIVKKWKATVLLDV